MHAQVQTCEKVQFRSIKFKFEYRSSSTNLNVHMMCVCSTNILFNTCMHTTRPGV
ncbi:hypothetical protein HMPREF9248_0907 [Fannyhessea vaginae PB189-T1-4]|uniref:Transposase putative helix-turn-helix domain-containing protein n=1 Tax=Fannyhessea vaginae PB189-T1-4 TaxID=866774 RepID=A0ABN0B0D0_9ACTN|nr:hypothetical protein HMPREF9248_0907 [Fannyhessea vaginae PB189-T1-4]